MSYLKRVEDGGSSIISFSEGHLGVFFIKWTFKSIRVEPRKKTFVPCFGMEVFYFLN